MKGKRVRKAQRSLLFYKLHFGIEPPYRLLVDGTLCNAAYENQINLSEQIPNLFQAEVKICTTQCAISELEVLQKKFNVSRGTSLSILKQFPVVECHHDKVGDVADCFRSKFTNNADSQPLRPKFCIGTQDQNIIEKARRAGGVPIFVLKSRVPHIEVPSEKSKLLAAQITKSRALSDHSKKVIAGIKREINDESSSEPVKKKRKERKGPNPLSCLKKKPKTQQPHGDPSKRTRNRRKRNKSSSGDLASLIKKVATN